jgi:O-methyltransferase involved in polyketide biosynthesis
LRALAFDTHTRRYLDPHPSANVEALAEGLQTSFWRLDASIHVGQFRWLTVDLPAIVDLRTRLLPGSPRMPVCTQSALDYSWTDRIDPSNGVFITAEGVHCRSSGSRQASVVTCGVEIAHRLGLAKP